jgi:hypothetical protein
VILDTHYDEFIRVLYQRHPGLDQQSYAVQLQTIYDSGFARADFLPQNLRRLGHEAMQLIGNAVPLQRRWAEEHGLRVPPGASAPLLARLRYAPQRIYRGAGRRLGVPSLAQPDNEWLRRVLVAQVKAFEPDVILNCNVMRIPTDVVRQLQGKARYVVAECGYPIPPDFDLTLYDLVVSCVPHFVERFRAAGIRAELLRLAFEPAILNTLGPAAKSDGVVFLGSFGRHHTGRTQLLETVCRHVPLQCWGPGGETLPRESPLYRRVHPPIWGYEMYRRLQEARMTLNIHIDIAEDFAGNMRLFEATGVGTLLITDWKKNLHDMFEPGKEVIAYRTPEECAQMIQYYLEHEDERREIALAGQQRTLRDHTYYHRMQELVEKVEAHVS